MPDYKVTLTRTVILKGVPKPLQLEHVVEDVPRPLAVLKSIGEIFEQEAENGFHLVPKEAVDYWHEQRTNGSMQEYELLSQLETRWGITSGIKELGNEPEPVPQQHHNGTAQQEEVPDFDTMLKNQLLTLQARNDKLNADIDQKTAERDRNDSTILRITQFLMTMTPTLPFPANYGLEPSAHAEEAHRRAAENNARIIPKKRRGRPPKAEAHAE